MRRLSFFLCSILFGMTVGTILREVVYVGKWFSGKYGFLRIQAPNEEQFFITFQERNLASVYMDLGVLFFLLLSSVVSFIFLVKSVRKEEATEEEDKKKKGPEAPEGPEYQKMLDI
jgi:hypothetical protein